MSDPKPMSAETIVNDHLAVGRSLSMDAPWPRMYVCKCGAEVVAKNEDALRFLFAIHQVQQGMEQERALMECGHPKACLVKAELTLEQKQSLEETNQIIPSMHCSACQREQQALESGIMAVFGCTLEDLKGIIAGLQDLAQGKTKLLEDIRRGHKRT